MLQDSLNVGHEPGGLVVGVGDGEQDVVDGNEASFFDGADHQRKLPVKVVDDPLPTGPVEETLSRKVVPENGLSLVDHLLRDPDAEPLLQNVLLNYVETRMKNGITKPDLL